MQEQKNAFRSLSEIFEFEHESSSNSSGMDLALHWNSNLNAEHSLNLPNYALPTNEANVAYPTPARHDGGSSSTWNPGQPSSSGHDLQQQTIHSEAKNETTWMHPLNGSAGPSFRLDEGQLQRNGSLAVISSDVNTNGDIHISGPSMGFVAEDDNIRHSESFDGRHLGLKRKASEGSSGESSLHGNPGLFRGAENGEQGWQGPVSVDSGAGVNPLEESPNQRSVIGVRGGAFADIPMPESSQRNTRMRTSPVYIHASAPSYNLWDPVSTSYTRHSHVMPTHQMLSGYLPYNNSAVNTRLPMEAVSTSQSPYLPAYPRSVPSYTVVGPSSSRPSLMSSSRSSGISRVVMSSALPAEVNSRTTTSSTLANQVSQLENDMTDANQDGSIWNASNVNASGSRSIASQVGSGSSGVRSASSSSWIPDQNSLIGQSGRLSALVHQPIFPSSGSDSGYQNANLPPVHLVGSTLQQQQMALPSGGARHRYLHVRSRLQMDRQGTGMPGVPLTLGSSATGSDWRRRLTSQIRNALILARQGENLRIEDVILNQSVFYGVADLHDRHRDMRLDVDNMSYEELLALEERIGNVSTGLSEETVLKCIKQRKHAPTAIVDAQEVEPCCICQEEYLEGEELGMLDCGHDFHTACIKQWLMLKNLCPICKTAALVT